MTCFWRITQSLKKKRKRSTINYKKYRKIRINWKNKLNRNSLLKGCSKTRWNSLKPWGKRTKTLIFQRILRQEHSSISIWMTTCSKTQRKWRLRYSGCVLNLVKCQWDWKRKNKTKIESKMPCVRKRLTYQKLKISSINLNNNTIKNCLSINQRNKISKSRLRGLTLCSKSWIQKIQRLLLSEVKEKTQFCLRCDRMGLLPSQIGRRIQRRWVG